MELPSDHFTAEWILYMYNMCLDLISPSRIQFDRDILVRLEKQFNV